MMEASDVLNIIDEKNQKNPDWKNRGLYRLLCNPTLHIMAYERLKSKPGNMTPGTKGETLDGYSFEDIEKKHTSATTRKIPAKTGQTDVYPQRKGKSSSGNALPTG
jgi:hypothetical protein